MLAEVDSFDPGMLASSPKTEVSPALNSRPIPYLDLP